MGTANFFQFSFEFDMLLHFVEKQFSTKCFPTDPHPSFPEVNQHRFYARWATEYEVGELDRAAARFWATNERYQLLYSGCCMDDILEDWDADEYAV